MGGGVSNKNLIVLNWKCRLFWIKRRLKIFRFFPNSKDLNMALILILYGWNIDEKKATFSTTPSPVWFTPKQNNSFATLGLNLIWNHSELEYVVLKNIFWAVFSLYSLILGEVRGSNSEMNSAAWMELCVLFETRSGLTDPFLGHLEVSLSLNLASNKSLCYIADYYD